MSAVTIRWQNADSLDITVDGKRVLSVSDLDEDGGRSGEPSVAWAAQVAVEAVAAALGADVTVERQS